MTQLFHSSRPIFVVGYMHSGTTMLYNALARHSTVYPIVGETKLLDPHSSFRAANAELQAARERRRYIEYVLSRVAREEGTRADVPRLEAHVAAMRSSSRGDSEQAALYVQIFRHVADYLAQQAGKKRWLEKTPSHVFYVDQMLQSIPDATVVGIVRDVRDVLASKRTRQQTVWTTDRYAPDQRQKKHWEKAYDPFWDTLSWKAAVHAGTAARERHAGHVLLVRYDRFVRDPQAEMRRICTFLDLSFEPQMLDVSAGIPAQWKPDDRSGGIHAASVGRWRQVLDESAVALCQWLAQEEMKQLGYALAPVSKRARAMIPFLLVRSSLDLFRRIYRRWRLRDGQFVKGMLFGYGHRLRKLVRN